MLRMETRPAVTKNGLPPRYTIGHSMLSSETLGGLSKDRGVETVVNLCAVRQSVRGLHFNQIGFEKLQHTEHFDYLFLREELGGRLPHRGLGECLPTSCPKIRLSS